MSFKLNKKEMMKEIVKCGKNPSYFIDNYAKISHPQKGLIPFRLRKDWKYSDWAMPVSPSAMSSFGGPWIVVQHV